MSHLALAIIGGVSPFWAVCKVTRLIINSVWGSTTCGTFLQSESGFCVGKEPEWAGAEVREQLRALEQFQKVLHLDANLGGGRWQGEGALRRIRSGSTARWTQLGPRMLLNIRFKVKRRMKNDSLGFFCLSSKENDDTISWDMQDSEKCVEKKSQTFCFSHGKFKRPVIHPFRSQMETPWNSSLSDTSLSIPKYVPWQTHLH